MTRESWRSRRRRELTPEERALWAKIAETVRPLSGRTLPSPPEIVAEPAAKPGPIRAATAKRAAPAAPSAQPKPPPLAPLEPKLAKTLKRGGAVDARLDLHGMRQSEAHDRLAAFLKGQQGRGARVVLIITGKGRGESAPLFEERGVLRRLVPAWLAEPGLRNVVIGFSEASAAHGGAGALYVRLRRPR